MSIDYLIIAGILVLMGIGLLIWSAFSIFGERKEGKRTWEDD